MSRRRFQDVFKTIKCLLGSSSRPNDCKYYEKQLRKRGSYLKILMEILSAMLQMINITFLKILNFRSTIILQVLFHFRGRRRLFPFNNVLFKQEISNDIILLCVDYDIAPRLEKIKAERNK